jgi:hypothetical protein
VRIKKAAIEGQRQEEVGKGEEDSPKGLRTSMISQALEGQRLKYGIRNTSLQKVVRLITENGGRRQGGFKRWGEWGKWRNPAQPERRAEPGIWVTCRP